MLSLEIGRTLRKLVAENKTDVDRQDLVITTLREQMKKTRETPYIQNLLAALPIPSAHNWTEEEIRKDDEVCDRAVNQAMKSFGEKVRAEHKEGLRKEVSRLVDEFKVVEAKQQPAPLE